MNQWYEDVIKFHKKFGVTVRDKPELQDIYRMDKRHTWLEEEVKELKLAYEEQDLEATADAIGDIIYVALGTAAECGIPMDAVWDEIQAANMRKETAGPGMKIRKPKGWEGPDIKKALGL